jgi:hypothetical protein
MTDPTSCQRGHPTETRQQLSDSSLWTESNIDFAGSQSDYIEV